MKHHGIDDHGEHSSLRKREHFSWRVGGPLTGQPIAVAPALQERIPGFRDQITGDSPCPVATSQSILTSKSVRLSTLRNVTSRAASPRRRPHRAPGQRSTRKPAAETSPAADVTFPIRTFPANEAVESAARRRHHAHLSRSQPPRRRPLRPANGTGRGKPNRLTERSAVDPLARSSSRPLASGGSWVPAGRRLSVSGPLEQLHVLRQSCRTSGGESSGV